ncbi:MAG: hypothetical protein HYT39_02165 [Candidatus Sungbacteria bacterium]|nr:hypothetical protein [Candidatus Sungbacteria bacterium]
MAKETPPLNPLGGAKGAEGLGNLQRRPEELKPVAPERKISQRGALAGVADSVLADKFEGNRGIEDATRDTMRFQGRRVGLNDADAMRLAAERGGSMGPTPEASLREQQPGAASGTVIPEAGSVPAEPEDALGIETPRSAEERLKTALEAARKELVRVEKDTTTELPPDYPQIAEKYEQARAEYVGNDVRKYILEQAEFLKQLVERDPTKLEWVRKGWKKLGAINITNVWGVSGIGKKIEQSGKLGFFASRMFNARVATSGILFGLAAGLPAAALPFLTVRAGMAAAGAGFGTYEIMEKRRLAKIGYIPEKEMREMTIDQVKERLLQLSAFAHVSGSWENVRGTFDKLKDKYERDLTEAIAKGTTLRDYMKGEVEKSMETLNTKFGEEERSRDTRFWSAVGAGALAVVGVPLIRKFLGLGEVASQTAAPKPTEDQVAYAEKVLAEAAKEGVVSPPGAPGAVEVGDAARELARGSTAVSPEDLQAEDFNEASRLARETAAASQLEFQAEDFNAASRLARESLEAAKEFKITFQPGEGPIHEARKALALYISRIGEKDVALQNLTPAQKIWAEERLWKLTQVELKGTGALKDVYHPGDSISFSRDNVEKVLAELKEKFGTPEKVARLNENLKDFTGRVNWNRYVIKGTHGVWEMDNGIKVRIPKQALAEAVADPKVGERVWDNMLKTLREHPDITVPGEEYEAPSQVIDYHPDLEKLSQGAEEVGGGKIDLTPALEEAGGGKIDLALAPEEAEKFRESFFVHYSGLRREYYDAIKNLSVGDFLKKRMFPFSPDQQFPYPQVDSEYPWINQTKIAHNRSMDLVRLQQKLRWSIGHYVAPDEQTKAQAMKVEEYLRKIVLQGK